MSDPAHPNAGSLPADEIRGSKSRHDTVLLSDVPEASSLIPDAAAQSASPYLSSSALATLGRRYDILGEAGHGSMGNVYKARDRETGETVAIKILKPEIASDQAMMGRFKNELLFARKITHKNVCRVHDFNRIGGIAYTSMEFVEGESLRSVLNRFGGLPLRKGIAVALQICSGLKEAHAQGIVHRDLKPENVMIDGQGNVKIMDFGIARSMEALTRMTGSMLGTPAYMAPEQVAGKPVDYRTDIYSLGLMLYEMFTGKQAFQADTAVAVALKQMRESPTPPHEIDPNIPVAIERAILKCLEKEPAKRFQSLAELESVLRTPATTAPPPMPVAPVATPLSPTHPSTAFSAGSFRSLQETEPKRTSPFAWLLFGLLLVGGVLATLRGMAIKNQAESLPAPAPLATPKPPDVALSIPVAAAPQPVGEKPAEAKAEEPAPAKSALTDSAKPVPIETPRRRESVPLKRQAELSPQDVAPRDVQQRAQKAFGEGSGSPSSPADNASTYLIVGRYVQEERAQKSAKKLEDLGLPATVLPRRGPKGEFYLVFTGPFGAARVSSVTQWLETQGFPDAHPFTLPGLLQKSNQ
jgi:serine/threonine protein kinase